MFFKLEHNKNYAYLFLIIVGLVMGSFFIIGEQLSLLLFALSFYYLGILQLRSGIMLNSLWTAKYRKEQYPFIFYIGTILLFAIGTFVLTTFIVQIGRLYNSIL